MSHSYKPSFYTEEALLDRLSAGAIEGDREVVFLIGAPASAPSPPERRAFRGSAALSIL